MTSYILRRLCLLPLTLFAIILVNFVILNLAPNEPANSMQRSSTGDASRQASDSSGWEEHGYLQFREHFGLTLPILGNSWPSISEKKLKDALVTLSTKKEEMETQKFHDLYSLWGDRSRFIMPLLLKEIENPANPLALRKVALNLFVRGGTKQGHVGPQLTTEEKEENRTWSKDNDFLGKLRSKTEDSAVDIDAKAALLSTFLASHIDEYSYPFAKKMSTFFVDTRFSRYFRKVITLDFGTIRTDRNKTVTSEVAKRVKYSLTLALIPMLITFVLCQFFGMVMAVNQNRWPDLTCNLFFLILFAVPIFVVAPFLIEKVALHHTFFFTNIPIPFSGFSSPNEIYENLTSTERLQDITLHIFLPLIAVIYGSLALQSRLGRTAFLEVLRQDYIRTARAKGIAKSAMLFKHVGRSAAITIVTSLAASLGVVLGGSLIVETVFEINGFGRFFYDAIVQRDYNVVLYSAFAGSLLTLIGYVIADISYMILDPRVSLE